MELKQLETFRMVASLRSFTQAATALGYAQSSVTAQIQALEREVGAPLFDRMGRRTVLTRAGERLLVQAQQMLAIAAEAVSRTAQAEAPAGDINLVSADSLLTYCLHGAIGEFSKEHRQVHLRVRTAGSNAEVRRQLLEGLTDIAFMYDETTRDSAGICVETLKVFPMAVAAAPGHRLARRKGVRPADLAGESLLLTILGCPYRNVFERSLLKSGTPYEVALELDNVEPLKRWAAEGMGLAALPEVVMRRELAEGSLVKLDWAGPALTVHAQMMWHKNRTMSRALEAFMDHVREAVGERMPPRRSAQRGRAAVLAG